jgi:hypothetical protein
MPAANERDGEVKDEVSRLENEVAIWRSRRIQRRGTTTGKVHVVRISKRVVPQSDPLVDRTSAIARR